MNKTYFPFSALSGRDSTLVRFSPAAAGRFKIPARAPGLFATVSNNEVLSRLPPVAGVGPMTRKRVRLSGVS
jgi:hypothetical protein